MYASFSTESDMSLEMIEKKTLNRAVSPENWVFVVAWR